MLINPTSKLPLRFLFCALLSSNLFGADAGAPPAATAAQGSGYIINIDNPSYRKLVVGVPPFSAPTSAPDPEVTKGAESGRAMLVDLLKFTDLFNIADDAIYKGMDQNKDVGVSLKIKGFEDVNMAQWKTVAIESLTLGKLTRVSTEFVLELRTADLNRNQLVLGKAYTMKSLDEMPRVLKLYVDRLLEAYTGRSGIFSSKLVFIGRRAATSPKQVFISDIDGTNVEQLTKNSNVHISPSWDAEGKRVAYTAFSGGKHTELYMMDLATRKEVKVSAFKGLNSGGSFFRDGKAIAYTGSVNGDADVYTKLPEENDRHPFLAGEGPDVDVAFSPDGRSVAWVSGRFGNPHIFRADINQVGPSTFKPVNEKRLTYAGWWNAYPSWSPDGQKIAFAGYDKDISRFDIFMMNSDGTKLERLTLKAGFNESPSWSPNGQLLVFHSTRVGDSDQQGPAQLYIMTRDGSNQRKIDTGLYEVTTPKWGPYLLK